MNTPCLYLKPFWFWEQNEYTLPVPKTFLILSPLGFLRSRFQPVCRPPRHVFPRAVAPTAEGAVPKYSSHQHRLYSQHLHVARRVGGGVWRPPVFTKHHSWRRRMLIKPFCQRDCAHWHCIHRCKAVLIFSQNLEVLPTSCHRDHRFSSEVDFSVTAHVCSYNILKMDMDEDLVFYIYIYIWKERSNVLLLIQLI